MRLLLSGDWHVGARTWGVDRLPEAEEGIEQILAYASSFAPDIVVLLGDIFHSLRYPGDAAGALVARTVSRLLSLPNSPDVFLVRGNHDWNGVRVWEHLDRSDRFRVVEDIEVVERPGLLLTLVPHLKRHVLRDDPFEHRIARALAPHEPRGRISICAAHAAIEGTVPGLREPSLSPTRLGELGIDALVCGHIHRHGEISNSAIPSFYTGALFRGDFAEEASDLGVILVDDAVLSCKPLCGRPLRTFAYPTLEDAAAHLPEALGASPEDCFVRVVLADEGGGEARLLDRLRSLPGGDRIVRVKGARLWETDGEEAASGDISLEALWSSYVEQHEERAGLRPLLTRCGLDLLQGAEPEELWRTLRQELLPDDTSNA